MLAEILLGILGNVTTDAIYQAVRRARPPHNHDLQCAINEAFHAAIGKLAKSVRSHDAKSVFAQLDADRERILQWTTAGENNGIIDALLLGDSIALRDKLSERLRPYLSYESRDTQRLIFDKLPYQLLAALGDVLKEERHARGWIAFQHEILQRLLELKQSDLSDTGQQRLVALSAEAAELARSLTDTLASAVHGLESMEATQRVEAQRLEQLLRELNRRSLASSYSGFEAAAQVTRLLDEGQFATFAGRQDVLGALDAMLEGREQTLVITAPPGSGKTALLAHWIKARHGHGAFIARHFFSRRYPATTSQLHACRNLLRQLCLYYETPNLSLPDGEVRDALRNWLENEGARPGEPLVIVIDALDEADADEMGRVFYPPLPNPLPEGVFVVVSCRADGAEDATPIYLQPWTGSFDCGRLRLAPLPYRAVAQWVRSIPSLSAIHNDDSFIAMLAEKTEGYPLYIQFQIEDLVRAVGRGEDPRAIIDSAPTGFKTYVERQRDELDKLDQIALPAERWRFFALLSVAKGQLRKEEIKAIAGLRDRDLRQMNNCWQVVRWLGVTSAGETTLYAFAHPVLAEYFAEALEDDGQEAVERLLAWCALWPTHRSSYALRHYSEHLYDLQRWDELFALARDEAYRKTQEDLLADQPYLPLETARRALVAAERSQNIPALAEFLLLLSQRHFEIERVDLMSVLERGDLERAWLLTDLLNNVSSVLWKLLICWEMHDSGNVQQAQTLLRELAGSWFANLSGWSSSSSEWEEAFGAYLLAQVIRIDRRAFPVLRDKILDRDNQSDTTNYLALLASYLDANSYFEEALDTALEVKELEPRSSALTSLATGCLARSDFEKWRAIFDAVRSVTDKAERDQILGRLADAAFLIGQTELARDVLAEIEDRTLSFQVLLRVAEAKAQSQDVASVDAIRGLLEEHLMANAVTDMEQYFRALAHLALCRLKAGHLDSATQILDGLPEEWQAATALKVALALAQAKQHNFAAAVETVALVQSPSARASLLCKLAAVQIEESDQEGGRRTFAQAFATARITEAWSDPINILIEVYHAQQASGDAEGASQTVAHLNERAAGDPREQAYVARETGQYQLARDAILRVEEYRRDDLTTSLALTLVKHGDPTTAVELAQGLWEKSSNEWSILSIAGALGEAGFFHEAVTLARSVPTGWHNDGSTLEKIAGAQIAAGDCDGALVTAELIDKAEKASYTKIAVALALSGAGRVTDGLAALDATTHHSKRVLGYSERGAVLLAIAVAQVQLSDATAARRTLAQMLEPESRTGDLEKAWRGALRQTLVAQCEYQQYDAAEETFAIVAQSITGAMQPSARSYEIKRLASAATQGFRYDLQALLSAMKRAGVMEEEYLRSDSVLAMRAAIEAQEGDIDQALLDADAISDLEKSQLLPGLILDMVRHDRIDDTEDVARRIERNEYAEEALAVIAGFRAHFGDLNGALRVARRLSVNEQQPIALAAVAAELALSGSLDEARELASEALQMTEAIESPDQRSTVLAVVGLALSTADRLEDEPFQALQAAAQCVNEVRNERDRGKLWSVLCMMMTYAGAYEEALDFWEQINTGGWTESFARSLVESGGRDYLGRLLADRTYDIELAYALCGVLARAYLEHATVVAELLRAQEAWLSKLPEDEPPLVEVPNTDFSREDFAILGLADRYLRRSVMVEALFGYDSLLLPRRMPIHQ